MLGLLSSAIAGSSSPFILLGARSLAQAPVAPLVAPVLILVLCVLAGIGTVLLLPSRLDAPFRGIGATLLFAAVVILAAIGIRAFENRISVYFWIFSLIALGGAVRVVTHSRPVYSALYFVLTVFATAGLFILMSADFMAAALVIIYAGAILITYVFVIMLASQIRSPGTASPMAEYDSVSRDPLIASVVGFAMMGMLLFVIFDKANRIDKSSGDDRMAAVVAAPAQGGTQLLGTYLFKNQAVNLELAGLILTLSTVGAIIIARRRVVSTEPLTHRPPPVEVAPMTPVSDDPYSIPVYGTENPRQKAYPEA